GGNAALGDGPHAHFYGGAAPAAVAAPAAPPAPGDRRAARRRPGAGRRAGAPGGSPAGTRRHRGSPGPGRAPPPWRGLAPGAPPRDPAARRATLGPLPSLREQAGSCTEPLIRECAEAVEDLAALRKTLDAALVDEPPLGVHEGGLIRESWNPGLAELRREVR